MQAWQASVLVMTVCGNPPYRPLGHFIWQHVVSNLRFQVLVFRFQQFEKFQITNHKYQTNHNDLNSKSQTIGVWSHLKFDFCSLEFICYLVLVICYFRFSSVRHLQFQFWYWHPLRRAHFFPASSRKKLSIYVVFQGSFLVFLSA